MSTTSPPPRPAAVKQPQLVSLDLDGSALTARFAGPNMGLRDVLIIASELGSTMSKLRGTLRVLVLDFSAVQFLSSIGLGMCVDLCQQASAVGARTIVTGANAELARLLRLMRIDRVCQIAHSAGELQQFMDA